LGKKNSRPGERNNEAKKGKKKVKEGASWGNPSRWTTQKKPSLKKGLGMGSLSPTVRNPQGKQGAPAVKDFFPAQKPSVGLTAKFGGGGGKKKKRGRLGQDSLKRNSGQHLTDRETPGPVPSNKKVKSRKRTNGDF